MSKNTNDNDTNDTNDTNVSPKGLVLLFVLAGLAGLAIVSFGSGSLHPDAPSTTYPDRVEPSSRNWAQLVYDQRRFCPAGVGTPFWEGYETCDCPDDLPRIGSMCFCYPGTDEPKWFLRQQWISGREGPVMIARWDVLMFEASPDQLLVVRFTISMYREEVLEGQADCLRLRSAEMLFYDEEGVRIRRERDGNTPGRRLADGRVDEVCEYSEPDPSGHQDVECWEP